jgi:cullin 4
VDDPALHRQLSSPISEENKTSRRRPRVDSEVVALPGSAASSKQQQPSAKPSPKRFKFGTDLCPTYTPMNSRTKGKAPEVIDLTPRPSFKPYGGAKKIVIKNFRPARTDETESYFNRTWDELCKALNTICKGEKLDMPLERLYRGVEDICRGGKDKELYETLRQICEEHLQKSALQWIIANGGTTNIEMLRSLLSQWKIWEAKTVF